MRRLKPEILNRLGIDALRYNISSRFTVPGDYTFWVPAHEAGHAVVAIASNNIPEYVRIFPGQNTGGVAMLANNRTNDNEWEAKIAAAGLAAEMMVQDSERPTLPEKEFYLAALNRALSDREYFARHLNFAAIGVDPNDLPELTKLFFEYAWRKTRPVILANMPMFTAFRTALRNYPFVGIASIRKITRRETPNQRDLDLDRLQEQCVIANVPYLEEPESLASKIMGRVKELLRRS
ncbi:hypothetical protein C3Y94_028035 [Rhizobium ruizarguesonis]|uniref:hypothetical protein n=1 Tax=Rhizobium ruizarguesonis TaxID=2081791 RepID=UPI001639CDC8|nr:hypothetical protein [Rhizobium ruizarguesonis]MBC2806984.1 hypothetical protein [Rhizobium ruizarguesonis]